MAGASRGGGQRLTSTTHLNTIMPTVGDRAAAQEHAREHGRPEDGRRGDG
jgi:hypothetical protein